MTTTIPNIDGLVAKLKARLAALGDARDCKSDSERATFWATYNTTQQTISELRNVPDDLTKPESLLAECEERRAIVLKKQASIEQQIADAPDWRAAADGRARDREYDRQQDLKRQLQMLHNGTLLSEPGRAFERLADLDQRIAELQQRIAALRARLASYLQLLAEPVTT